MWDLRNSEVVSKHSVLASLNSNFPDLSVSCVFQNGLCLRKDFCVGCKQVLNNSFSLNHSECLICLLVLCHGHLHLEEHDLFDRSAMLNAVSSKR